MEYVIRAVVGAILGLLVVLLFWVDPTWLNYAFGAVIGAILTTGGNVFIFVGGGDD